MKHTRVISLTPFPEKECHMQPTRSWCSAFIGHGGLLLLLCILVADVQAQFPPPPPPPSSFFTRTATDALPDVNGDGRADLVFRDTTTGQIAAWLLTARVSPGTG